MGAISHDMDGIKYEQEERVQTGRVRHLVFISPCSMKDY